MGPDELGRYREMLLEKRGALLLAVEALARDSAESNQASNFSKLPVNDADIASDAVDQDIALLSLESEDELLRKVDAALARMDDGTYGTCEECGARIDAARLDFLPFATACIACQKKLDDGHRLAQDREGGVSRKEEVEEAETARLAGEEEEDQAERS